MNVATTDPIFDGAEVDEATTNPQSRSAHSGVLPTGARQANEELVVEVDGTKVLVSAREEIVIRCGEASITLTRAGKILIRGSYVATHSTSVNRITGATVEIN